MLWNKCYAEIFISQRCWHVFGTLTKLSLSPTFHNIFNTLWARFVGHFEKYFIYLFIQSSHFARGICFAEVEHKIIQWNGVGIKFYSVNLFLKHVLIWYTRIFPYCRKVATTLWISHRNIVNECCPNVVMFSYNVLRQHSWNFPGICFSKLNLPNFSQLSPNVVETLLQPYIASWEHFQIITNNFIISQLKIQFLKIQMAQLNGNGAKSNCKGFTFCTFPVKILRQLDIVVADD